MGCVTSPGGLPALGTPRKWPRRTMNTPSTPGSFHPRDDRQYAAGRADAERRRAWSAAGGCWSSSSTSAPGGARKTGSRWRSSARPAPRASCSEGQTVVELTSGNTGTGLAIVCRAMGHPFVAVISRGNSVERVRQMDGLRGRGVVVDQAEGAVDGQVSGDDLALVEERAAEVVAQRGAFRVDQFQREANVLAHERHTGPELWEQSEGQIDVFVDMAGTCGSFTGVAGPSAVQSRRCAPTSSSRPAPRCLAGGAVTNPRHRIQGAGYARDRPRPVRPVAGHRLRRGHRRAGHRRGASPGRRGGDLRRILHRRPPRRRLEAAGRARSRRHDRVPGLRQRA